MKKLIFLGMLLMLLVLACDDEADNDTTADEQTTAQDSSQLTTEVTEATSLLIGRWELVEKRIPDIGSIPLGNIFYTFSEDGKVRCEHNDDSGIEEETSSFTFQEELLLFNETAYEMLSFSGDTLYLQSNTDGITEKSVFVRQ